VAGSSLDLPAGRRAPPRLRARPLPGGRRVPRRLACGPAPGFRTAGLGTTLEQVVQHVDHVAEVDGRVAVDVREAQRIRRRSSEEEVVEKVDRVGDVDIAIAIRVAAGGCRLHHADVVDSDADAAELDRIAAPLRERAADSNALADQLQAANSQGDGARSAGLEEPILLGAGIDVEHADRHGDRHTGGHRDDALDGDLVSDLLRGRTRRREGRVEKAKRGRENDGGGDGSKHGVSPWNRRARLAVSARFSRSSLEALS